MSYLLIMNPGSRSGQGRKLWQTWQTGLDRAHADYTRVFTDRIGHAVEIARNAGSDAVVAVGGDGTINEVLDGVVQSGRPDLAMGVLYSGTSPDFCRFHGIPVDPQQAINALLSGTTRRVDVARITYHDASGRQLTAHFGCSCNIGVGASVARFANKWRRYLGDIPGTAAGLICAVARDARVDIDLEIDGTTQCLSAVNNLTIAKNPHIASGLKLQIDLRPDDGKLVAIAIHEKGRLGILGLLPRFYSGSVATAKGVFLTECTSIVVSSQKPQEIEFDGDPRGYLPARIDLVPRALTLIGCANE